MISFSLVDVVGKKWGHAKERPSASEEVVARPRNILARPRTFLARPSPIQVNPSYFSSSEKRPNG